MPVECLLQARKGSLVPIDALGADILAKVPEGTVLRVEWTRARNLRHHRLFFALLNTVFEAQEKYLTQEDLLDAIKIRMGYYFTRREDGQTVFLPRSISFSDMDQDAFDRFYRGAVRVILEDILPGVASRDLERRVHDLLGERRLRRANGRQAAGAATNGKAA